MGKIIILGSEKGGVAKTTSTYNLAYCLAKERKKVLAVDFDSQAQERFERLIEVMKQNS